MKLQALQRSAEICSSQLNSRNHRALVSGLHSGVKTVAPSAPRNQDGLASRFVTRVADISAAEMRGECEQQGTCICCRAQGRQLVRRMRTRRPPRHDRDCDHATAPSLTTYSTPTQQCKYQKRRQSAMMATRRELNAPLLGGLVQLVSPRTMHPAVTMHVAARLHAHGCMQLHSMVAPYSMGCLNHAACQPLWAAVPHEHACMHGWREGCLCAAKGLLQSCGAPLVGAP